MQNLNVDLKDERIRLWTKLPNIYKLIRNSSNLFFFQTNFFSNHNLKIIYMIPFFILQVYTSRSKLRDRCFSSLCSYHFSSPEISSKAFSMSIAFAFIFDQVGSGCFRGFPLWFVFIFVLKKREYMITTWLIIGCWTTQRLWSNKHGCMGLDGLLL